MGLFHKDKQKKLENLTPDMAGYRPSKEWWPDLTEYRKVMLLHNISLQDVKALLEEYAAINADEKEIVCDFFYTPLPDDRTWICLEFPNFNGAPHYQNFWNYQNLLIWFSQKTDREFCLAIPQRQGLPLFMSMRDTKNAYGDSSVGIYASRDFHFEIPGEIFQWGPVPTSAFNYVGYLKEFFSFDFQWLSETSQRQWEKVQITLTIPK